VNDLRRCHRQALLVLQNAAHRAAAVRRGRISGEWKKLRGQASVWRLILMERRRPNIVARTTDGRRSPCAALLRWHEPVIRVVLALAAECPPVHIVWWDRMNLRPITQAVVSVTMMGAALYVMVGQPHDVDSQRWASGTLGAIMSYWLTGRGR